MYKVFKIGFENRKHGRGVRGGGGGADFCIPASRSARAPKADGGGVVPGARGDGWRPAWNSPSVCKLSGSRMADGPFFGGIGADIKRELNVFQEGGG